MISTRESSQVVSVPLTQHEGRELERFLDQLRHDLSPEFYPAELDLLQDRVAEANAIAIWLRENVKLELPWQPGLALLEALHVGLEEASHEPEQRSLLTSIAESLTRCLLVQDFDRLSEIGSTDTDTTVSNHAQPTPTASITG